MDSGRTDVLILRRQFLTLMQGGLWGHTVGSTLFTDEVRWSALFHMAQSQALLGVIFDGINLLPAACRPPQSIYFRWCAAVAQVEQTNEWLDKRAGQVVDIYREAELHPLLLKGQGIARCYPHPEHRQCGDIDLYLGISECTVANRLIERRGGRPEAEANEIHTGFNFFGAVIENHRYAAQLNAPIANHRFQRFTDLCMARDMRVAYMGDIPVLLPSPTFDAVFLFVHAFKHLLNSGVGFRQLCDWCRLLYIEYEHIDHVRMVDELSRMGLLKAAQVFGYVAIHYMGLPPSDLPFEVDHLQQEGERLVDEIFATGNFGQHDTRIAPRPAGYWAGKWHTFSRAVRRCARLYRLAPAEAVFHPVTLVRNSFTVQCQHIYRLVTHILKR